MLRAGSERHGDARGRRSLGACLANGSHAPLSLQQRSGWGGVRSPSRDANLARGEEGWKGTCHLLAKRTETLLGDARHQVLALRVRAALGWRATRCSLRVGPGLRSPARTRKARAQGRGSFASHCQAWLIEVSKN